MKRVSKRQTGERERKWDESVEKTIPGTQPVKRQNLRSGVERTR
jgi:hypothetical protein